jgi:hypothetical protein
MTFFRDTAPNPGLPHIMVQPRESVQEKCARRFGEHRVPVYAPTLQGRLPATLVVAEQREREIYGLTEQAEIDRVLKSYSDFVELCARKEEETGEPCLIIAIW